MVDITGSETSDRAGKTAASAPAAAPLPTLQPFCTIKLFWIGSLANILIISQEQVDSPAHLLTRLTFD